MTNGNPSGYNAFSFNSALDLPFKGVWSNGWWSTGVLLVEYDYAPELPGMYGYAELYITTMTPEPSSLALCAAGLLSIIGVLRRKLLR
jgi:hypothetical protein